MSELEIHTQSNPVSPSLRYRAPAPVRFCMRTLSATAPGVASRVAGEIFCRPRRRPLRSEERRYLESAHAREIVDGSRRWAGWQWGENGSATVLFHHGWGGRGPQLSAFAPPLVAQGYRVIAFDAVAHGDSPGRIATLPTMAEDLCKVARVLEAEGRVEAIVAHSMGGMITARAMQQGLSISRACFVSPPGEMHFYSHQFMRAMDITPDVHQRMEDYFRDRYGLAMDGATAEALSRDQSAELFLVYDEDDADVPQEHAQRWVKAWTGATEWKTHGLGHRRILHNAEVVRRVTDFVAATQSSQLS